MAVEFSLVPGPSLDIVGIPDIEVMRRFLEGDLGISEAIYDSFKQRTRVGLNEEVLQTFDQVSNNSTNNINGGIRSFEKTIVQSVFETQKPYMEVAKAVLDGLVVTEDIIAAALAGYNNRSLKPRYNPESLYSKLNKMEEDLNDFERISSPSYNSFENIPEVERIQGIQIERLDNLYDNKPTITVDGSSTIDQIDLTNSNIEYTYVTVSIHYSTGIFIEGIPYIYKYKYIVDNPSNNNSSEGNPSAPPIELPEPETEDKKPVIIFDIWVDEDGDGRNLRRIIEDDIEDLPWDVSDKWNGVWYSWDKDPGNFRREYTSYMTQFINDQLDKEGISDYSIRQQIITTAIDSIPFYDQENNINFHRDYMNSSILRTITDYGGPLANNWINRKRFSYMPRKIDDVWYDPEVDYHLQLIKIEPSKDISNNDDIENNPLSNRYDGNSIHDVLLPGDYGPEKFTNISGGQVEVKRIRKDRVSDPFVREKAVYYVIEGVYKDRREFAVENNLNINGDPQGTPVQPNNSQKYYKFGKPGVRLARSIAYIISRFAKFCAKYLSEIIATISLASTLFTNPFNFIFEILLEKMSDAFDIFGSETVAKVSELKQKNSIEEKREFVENDNVLKNIVSFDDDGNYRLISDGSGFLSFLGVGFGMGTTGLSPKMSIDRAPNVQSLIDQADDKIEQAGNLIESKEDKKEKKRLLKEAMEKLQMAQKIDPNNEEVNQRILELRKETGIQENMIFQSIIEIITFPIKIVTEVIEYILDFFTSLSPTKLVTKIPEFLSFTWILDFFKPSKLFELLGISANPSKLSEWGSEAESASEGEFKEYDTSEVLSTPFSGISEKYTTSSLPTILQGGSKILLLMGSLFTFIQEIVNGILCFLFNIFNIDKLFNCPRINLEKFSDGSLSNEDISLILENDDSNFLSQLETGTSSGNTTNLDEDSITYKYNIRLQGSIVKNLSYEELQAFIASNQNLIYKYNF